MTQANKTKRVMRSVKKILAIAARSAGIAIASAALLIYIGGQISSAAGRIMKSRGDLAAFNKKYELLDQMKKDRDSLIGIEPKLEASLPSPDNLPIIADYFNTLGAKTNNIFTIHFSQGIKLNASGLAEIAFTMRVLGTPRSIADLASATENAPYFIKINGISVSFADNMLQSELNASGIVYLKNYED